MVKRGIWELRQRIVAVYYMQLETAAKAKASPSLPPKRKA
jgi:hypothetical protein